MPNRPRPSAILLAACSAALWAGVAVAQDQPPSERQLLEDFNHYVRINQRDAAGAVARQLLARGLTAEQWVKLIEDSGQGERFIETLIRAQKMPEIADPAAQMDRLFNQGKLDRVRNPAEIRASIGDLTGQALARMFARERLVASGEYGLPLLLRALVQQNDPALRAEVFGVLVDMGRQAVSPLCAALPGLEPAAQEIVADVLGSVGYRSAMPYLVELRGSTQSQSVRDACDRAMRRIDPLGTPAPASELYAGLAEDYYEEKSELTSFPGEDHQLYWTFDPGIGLFPTALRTEVYHEAMAMRLAEQAMRLRSENYSPAVSLWVAANLRREIETPAGYDNPTYADSRRDAGYYAVAAGSEVCQMVLSRALADRNTPLVRRALAALDLTAGGSALWESESGRPPLLDALRYPNRRVRFEAALALGRAHPRSAFEGSDRVVPTLASAIRDSSSAYAVVVSENSDQYQSIRRVLEASGYTVLPDGRSLAELEGPIAEAPGIDLVVTSLPTESTRALIRAARDSAALGASPILAMTAPMGAIELEREFSDSPWIAVRQTGLSAAQIGASASSLVASASGGLISAAEARAYQDAAIATLRELAVSGSPVLDVSDAALQLIAALHDGEGAFKLRVAEVLAHIGQKRAQVALMDAALSATGDDRVALLGVMSGSAKRHGNLLEERQVMQLVQVARSSAPGEAAAAVALMGSLNLPNADLVDLILKP